MRLISKILGFILSKAFIGGAMMLVLFVGYVAIGQLQAAVDRQDQLEQTTKDEEDLSKDLAELKRGQTEALNKTVASLKAGAKEQIDEGKQELTDQKRKVTRLEQNSIKVCGVFHGKLADAVLPGRPCQEAQRKVNAARARLRDVTEKLHEAERDLAVLNNPKLTDKERLERLHQTADPRTQSKIKKKEVQLAKTRHDREKLTRDQASSLAGWLVTKWGESRESLLKQWTQAWLQLLGIVLVVMLAPVVWRTVGYFVVMPVVSRARKSIQLSIASEHPTAVLSVGAAERTLPIQLAAGEVLSARSEHVRPVRGKARSQVLYDWSAPFISYAAGLHSLSRIVGDEEGTEATLATPDDPSSYLMRIDFTDHPGVVVHPRFVVGVMGAPKLKTRWNWGTQSLATWQVRYIMFTGTGSLIVQGSGDVQATSPGDRSTKMEQHLMMGFDARLTGRVNRTEVFWPYLWGRTPLVDDEFSGPYLFFWQKAGTKESTNPAVKAFNAIFSALGKLLGF